MPSWLGSESNAGWSGAQVALGDLGVGRMEMIRVSRGMVRVCRVTPGSTKLGVNAPGLTVKPLRPTSSGDAQGGVPVRTRTTSVAVNFINTAASVGGAVKLFAPMFR